MRKMDTSSAASKKRVGFIFFTILERFGMSAIPAFQLG